jgi:protein-arginine kinase activator protein McsA
MPSCVKCGQNKPELEFSWRWQSRGIRQKVCKVCRREEIRQWYERHREEHLASVRRNTDAAREKARQWVWQYLAAHGCADCSERDPRVLEFDHVRGVKYKDVSKMVAQGYSLEAIQAEIAKCEVRCANCHRRRTRSATA